MIEIPNPPKFRWQTIYRRIYPIKKPRGAEIGVYRGKFSRQLLWNIPRLRLHLIDIWSLTAYMQSGTEGASEDWKKIYTTESAENLEAAKVAVEQFKYRYKIVRGSSVEMARKYDDQYFDFVYLDADHSYESVKSDILAWRSKIKVGGWLCGHDYNVFPGVNKAVNELCTDVEFDIDYMWFMRVVR